MPGCLVPGELLPEDAPPDHEAHSKVRYEHTHVNPFAHFYYRSPTGGRGIHFQCTLRSSGSRELAELVARACYMQFEKGHSMTEVKEFRKAIYDRFDVTRLLDGRSLYAQKMRGEAVGGSTSSRDAGSQDHEKNVGAEANTPESSLGRKGRETAASASNSPAKCPRRAKNQENGSESGLGRKRRESAAGASNSPAKCSKRAENQDSITLEEDAPADSAAHKKIWFRNPSGKLGSGLCYFRYKVDGSDKTFQTTVLAAGSKENAMRIVRLCYVMLVETGAPRDEVEKYRNELYLKCGGIVPPNHKPVKAPGPDLNQALCMEGRDINRINNALNGVYALIPGGFNNTYAYKKVCNDAGPFFLFYSLAKEQWRINDQLDDSTKVFAYANAPDEGKMAPPDLGSRLQWHVFDGKEHGYKEDPAVQCRAFAKNVGEPNKVVSAEQYEEPVASPNSSLGMDSESDVRGPESTSDSDSD